MALQKVFFEMLRNSINTSAGYGVDMISLHLNEDSTTDFPSIVHSSFLQKVLIFFILILSFFKFIFQFVKDDSLVDGINAESEVQKFKLLMSLFNIASEFDEIGNTHLSQWLLKCLPTLSSPALQSKLITFAPIHSSKYTEIISCLTEHYDIIKSNGIPFSALIFVSTQRLAVAVCEMLKAEEDLPFLKADKIVGLSGSSIGQQEKTLKRFVNGDVNVLVATSVVSEGLIEHLIILTNKYI